MKAVFGIHIGNTNASLASCKHDKNPEVIVNEAGERITPAIVTITNEEIIVGSAAKTGIASNWKSTIFCNKSLLNTRVDEDDQINVGKIGKNVETKIIDGDLHYCIPLKDNEKYITPCRIAACIFQKLHSIAKSGMNITGGNLSCVLLVPQHLSDNACENYKTAAESAGWEVMQIINETAAAILAYSLLERKEPSQTVLVYRLGGTTCDVAAYDLSDGMLFLLDSKHCEDIGGDDFTQILTEHFATDFFRKYKLDPRENRRSMVKLTLASENCVHVLSKMQTANCFIESLQEGIDFTANISRGRFELMIQPILMKFLQPLKDLLDKLQLDEPVNKIILCGGASNIPKLKYDIASLFDINTTQILTHLNPDEVLALGAAKQAYCLLDNDVTDYLPRSILIP